MIMRRTRVIPVLLLRGSGLVKTVRFEAPRYLGDPVNILRLFNDKEVDEVAILDVTATPENHQPQLRLIEAIVSECFMPVAYGGGIRTVEDVQQILAIGVEKVIINTQAGIDHTLISRAAAMFGNQAIVGGIDVKAGRWAKQYTVFSHGGRRKTSFEPVVLAQQMAAAGAGEILLTSIDRDGTTSGYDLELVRRVAGAVSIPVVACGGAGCVQDFVAAIGAGASAVAAGSMFVFKGRHNAVLISYPESRELRDVP